MYINIILNFYSLSNKVPSNYFVACVGAAEEVEGIENIFYILEGDWPFFFF